MPQRTAMHEADGAVGRKMTEAVTAAARGGGENPPAVSERPALLMLAHTLPDPLGDAAAARAWQLLRTAALSHRVYLACLAPRRVHLNQWQALHDLAHEIHLQDTAAAERAAALGISVLDEVTGEQWRYAPVLRGAIGQWSGQVGFDTVLTTHPALWTFGSAAPCRLGICDLPSPRSVQHRHASHRTRLWRTWHRRQARLHEQHERLAAGTCDVLTVSRNDDRYRYRIGSRQPLLLTDAVDLRYFAAVAARHQRVDEPPINNLVLHADWDQGLASRATAWFLDSIWPRIRTAVSNVVISSSHTVRGLAALDRLADASVVVSPLTEPLSSRRPLLQAMALSRPVIAPLAAARQLGARHGEHLLTSRRDRDWLDHCVAALRSQDMRQQLARGARSFVESHCPIEHTGQLLIQALRQSGVLPTPALARAA